MEASSVISTFYRTLGGKLDFSKASPGFLSPAAPTVYSGDLAYRLYCLFDRNYGLRLGWFLNFLY